MHAISPPVIPDGVRGVPLHTPLGLIAVRAIPARLAMSAISVRTSIRIVAAA
jgi:hypothetical protein